MSDLSGIEINENGPVTGTVTGWNERYFVLPPTFKRGTRIPEITGIQFCHQIDDAENFSIDYKFTRNLEDGVLLSHTVFPGNSLYPASDPSILKAGTITGANSSGTYIWSEIYFDSPVTIEEEWLDKPFSVVVNSSVPTWTTADGIRFRLLANIADSGEDFLGNQFRSIAVRSVADSFDTRLDPDSYWLSKPNPSKFAIESLYFDMRDLEGRPTVVDRLLLDPITPGIAFHLYYSNDGQPGTTQDDWDDRLWNPVSTTFRAIRRQEHAFPEPVVGKYIKIEFSHLQAHHYSPGTFHQPTIYKKYPKWVIDYFLAKLGASSLTNDPYVARRVGVTFDAFELAYNYYLDDLKQDPNQPEKLNKERLGNFMADRKDKSDQVDYDTLSRIKLSLKPFQQTPGQLGNGLTYAPALYSEVSDATSNYPIERLTRAIADTTQVSNDNRTSLLVEHNFPPMFFYLTARHKYREVSASFTEDRAYFVGIRELAFSRDIYSERYDSDLYVETLADPTNTIRNDFLEDGYPKPKPVKH